MISNKRGLSNVITTLIIILLSMVAIGIVWAVISQIVKSGSDDINLGIFTTSLEIKEVLVGAEDISISVKRNRGEGDFIAIDFVFFDGTDNEVVRKDSSLIQLARETFTFVVVDFIEINVGNLESISIAPIYESESGKKTVGNIADTIEITAVCGNGFIQDDEECDDGNTDNGDGCLNTCVEASCGDDYIQTGMEECEVGGVGCTISCECDTGTGYEPDVPADIDCVVST